MTAIIRGGLLLAVALLVTVSVFAHTQNDDPARTIVERAVAAHGGDAWLRPGTLILSGEAVFYSPDSAEPRSRADDYRMWRVMDPDRTSSHGADGKVRIHAQTGGETMFEVGYDGETTWTEQGVMPKAEADAYWASSFGFGIIRSALRDGFTLESAPPRSVDGHAIDLVRVIAPDGQTTLFGFDRDSGFIRYMGFGSPRGWHERHYDDFIRLPGTGWVQATTVTLFYDGIRSNTVYWRGVKVGEPIPDTVFKHRGD
ncbi:MAG: hypothetical protein V2J26_02240 [Pacificimonas sp.]|jgi:hypothetical protein|nr:hypothetical protein [Pacificimonas sp.]